MDNLSKIMPFQPLAPPPNPQPSLIARQPDTMAQPKPASYFFRTSAPKAAAPVAGNNFAPALNYTPAHSFSAVLPSATHPAIAQIDAEAQKAQYPGAQVPLNPDNAMRIRQSFGGNDTLALKNLMGKDPDLRSEVQRYQNGDMAGLSPEAQANFPTFILNSHYLNDTTAEMPANIDTKYDPERTGKGWVDWLRKEAASLPVMAAGGAADEAQFVTNFFRSPESFQAHKNDTPWHEAVAKVLDPNDSLENIAATGGQQMQIAAGMLGGKYNPITYPMAALGGLLSETARGRMQGEDPNAVDMAIGAAKGAGGQAIANVVAPISPAVFSPATALGRIGNASIAGGIIAPAITAPSEAIDVARGKQTVGGAILGTAESIPTGMFTGAAMQTGAEGKNFLFSGYKKLANLNKTPAAKQYEIAVQHGGEEAKTAMSQGVSPEDALFLQTASPGERFIYMKQHAIANDNMYNPRSTSNVEVPQGELAGNKIREIINIQNKAGESLGNIRDNELSSTPDQDINPARNLFVKALYAFGISTTGGKVDASQSLIDPTAANGLALAFSKIPESGTASQVEIDDIIQNVNQIIQNTNIDESAARGILGTLKSALKTTLANSLSGDVKAEYLRANQTYADTMEVLRMAKKATPFTGRLGAQYSLHDFKTDVLSGDMDAPLGTLMRGLTPKGEGKKTPFVDKIEGMTDKNIFVRGNDGVERLVPNPNISPYSGKTFDTKLQNVVQYGARLSDLLKLQKATGAMPEGKAGGSALNPMNWWGNIQKVLQGTPLTTFNAMNDYLYSLEAGQVTPHPKPPAAATELMNQADTRRSDLINYIQEVQRSGGTELQLSRILSASNAKIMEATNRWELAKKVDPTWDKEAIYSREIKKGMVNDVSPEQRLQAAAEARIKRALTKQGYDGVKYTGGVTDQSGEYQIFDPKKLSSN